MTAIGAEGLRLRSASDREGLVAWDTLRDPGERAPAAHLRCALTIDATQGLTSTEHIEAMPAGTRAVDAFKAYTSAAGTGRRSSSSFRNARSGRRSRRRRPIKDPRPIRAADVWANMARSLARQPAKLSALAFP